MSSLWLRAGPRALCACRFGLWPVAIAAASGLALAGGCGVVTPSSAVTGDASTYTPDASGGGFGEGPADAAISCRASDVSTYAPGTYQPAITPSGSCLGADGGGVWDTFFDDCLGSTKSNDACDAFKAAPGTASCASCILTPYTANRLGPILDYGQFVGGNVAGCIELTEPGDLTCAKAVQALTDCELAACEANCPVSDATSLAARDTCVSAADVAGCDPFFDAAAACRAAENEGDEGGEGGLSGACMLGSFRDFYDEVVPIFCGRPASDASEPLSDAGIASDGEAFDGDRAAFLTTDATVRN